MRTSTAVAAASLLLGLAQYSPGQNLFPGAGIGGGSQNSQSMPFGQGRGMDHLVRQIESADPVPDDPKPFAWPQWARPRWPEFLKPSFMTGSASRSGWKSPGWLTPRGGQNSWSRGPSGGGSGNWFRSAGDSMSKWSQRTGESIRDAGASIRDSSARLWENLTAGFQKPGWFGRSANSQPPVQPPSRTANNWGGQRVSRF